MKTPNLGLKLRITLLIVYLSLYHRAGTRQAILAEKNVKFDRCGTGDFVREIGFSPAGSKMYHAIMTNRKKRDIILSWLLIAFFKAEEGLVGMIEKKAWVRALASLLIYTPEEVPAVGKLLALFEAEDPARALAAYAAFFRELAAHGFAGDLKGYLSSRVLYSDNLFAREASCCEKAPESLAQAAAHDLAILEQIGNLTPADAGLPSDFPFPAAGQGLQPLGDADWGGKVEALAAFHRSNGCGLFARHKAFLWRDGQLVPVTHTNEITLDDLKTYEEPRRRVLENTQAFMNGLPANNVLLYGDRGTGKSSTVHAILNRYAPEGLRMIEMPKSAIAEFPKVVEKLRGTALKFIIFIDDLSFSTNDSSYAQLKAALEGGLAARRDNMLIYATSNLRHLVREKFSDREGDELHRRDTMQEQLSLADRFGLMVTFINPGRQQYYDILDGIAADRQLPVSAEELHAGAERWALSRGGRSPRTARQYIDHLEARLKLGLGVD